MEREISAIKRELTGLKSQPPNTVQQETHQMKVITEIHDRNSRSRNLIVHNIESESIPLR